MGKLKIKDTHKKVLYIVLLFFYAALMIYAQTKHEFWRDEFQAWNIARDLSFIDIVKQMQFEGHSCLWHLIIMPFAKLGLPPISMGIVSVVFMVLAAILIMYKSPFHFVVKLLILLSSPFLYFYSIQSRVYSIIPFVICILAIVYPKRMEKPILFAVISAILINTHAIMIPFVGLISLFFLKDVIVNKKVKEKKYWFSFGIILLGLIIFFLQISNSIGNNSIIYDIEVNELTYAVNPIINNLYHCLYGFIYEIDSLVGVMILDNMPFIYFLIGLVVVFIILAFIFSFKNALIVILPYLIICYFHIFMWFSIPQRTTMLLFYMIYALWTHYDDLIKIGKKLKSFYVMEFILCVFCVFTIPFGIKSLYRDINYEISGALDTAKYIEKNLEDAIFICPVDYVATSVAGYIDEPIFYNNIREEYFSFVNWDQFWSREISFDEYVSGMNKFIRQNNNVYILYSKELFFVYDIHMLYLEKNGYIEQVYQSPIGDKQESYVIYKFTNKYYSNILYAY